MMTRRTVLLSTPLALGACAKSPASQAAWPALVEGQQALQLQLDGRAEPLRFWLFLPPGYLASPASWPLLVFLHGSGERGGDLEVVKMHGPPKHAALGADYPFVLCSPQLEAGASWNPDTLHALQAALRQRLRIDAARVLATGLSLGGHGVWNWAAAYPQDLAGIAPVCGFGEPARVCRAAQVPVRAYHGAADSVVPLARQQACVDALRACGGVAELTVYPGVGHNAWDPAYQDAGLVPWLMKQRRP